MPAPIYPVPRRLRAGARSFGVPSPVVRFSEPRLIAIAYAFEQATLHRVPPKSTPPLPSDFVSR